MNTFYLEFNGNISIESKKTIQQYQFKNSLIVSIISFIIIGAVIILLSVFYNIWWLIFLLVPIIMSIMLLINPFINPELPLQVKIEDDLISVTCQVSQGKSNKLINVDRNVKHVKNVIELESCYYIVFKFPHKLLSCLCQKDLLINGSIEQFEKLFEGKIIKKSLK